MTSVFGRLLTPDDAGQALEQHIRTWQRAYLDFAGTEAARKGRPFPRRLPSIRSYRHSNDRPEKWIEDELPCVVIVTEPADVLDRGETITLGMPVAFGIIAGADEHENTDRLAKAYGFAVALLLVQKPNIGVGTVEEIGNFDFGQAPDRAQRTMGMTVFGAMIVAPDAMTVFGGPAAPTPEPPDPDDPPPAYGETPEVAEDGVEITLEHLDR